MRKSIDEAKIIGEIIHKARIEKRLTIKELSSATGIEEATLKKYETGQRRMSNITSLKKIFYVLDIDEKYFLDSVIESVEDNGVRCDNEMYSCYRRTFEFNLISSEKRGKRYLHKMKQIIRRERMRKENKTSDAKLRKM